MPELPEVETTKNGILPHVKNQKISEIIIRQSSLRWPVPKSKLKTNLVNKKILGIKRRAKYLIFYLEGENNFLVHLGMSGSLCITDQAQEIKKHDHIDIVLSNNKIIRYHDPRRFGSFLWAGHNPLEHKLLKNLGPEPLSFDFSGNYLYEKAKSRSVNIKNFIMNQQIVVGVGNIYACESLFLAKINPKTPANKVSLSRYEELAKHIKKTLESSIKQGGTTLKDFTHSDGKAGYFKQKLKVYDKYNEPCLSCKTLIKKIVLGQRSTFYCNNCQK